MAQQDLGWVCLQCDHVSLVWLRSLSTPSQAPIAQTEEKKGHKKLFTGSHDILFIYPGTEEELLKHSTQDVFFLYWTVQSP